MRTHDVDAMIAARRAAMRLCASAEAVEIDAVLVAHGHDEAPVEMLRPAEIGLVMLRGRAGGDGAQFNLGEATVTRAAIRQGGRIGHAMLLGRDRDKAVLAARIDALMQDETLAGPLLDALSAGIGTRIAAQAQTRRGEIAATRVNFFTLVRGDD